MSDSATIERLETKIDQLTEMVEQSYRASYIIYRRTAALAYMIERLGNGSEPQMTQALRAEVDATIEPEVFEALAVNDSAQFIHRYGQRVYNEWQKHGLKAITPIGEMAPLREEYRAKMQ